MNDIEIYTYIFLGNRFNQVACGWYHTLAVSRCGRVFAWGSGVVGQLGTGPKPLRDGPMYSLGELAGVEKQLEPVEVPGLVGIHIEWVCCGPTSSLGGRDSEAYAWGEAPGILQSEEDGGKRVFFPQTLLDGLHPRVRTISCTESHLVLCGGCAFAMDDDVGNDAQQKGDTEPATTERSSFQSRGID